ncbi:4-hydroxy-3-methylbut-2-en-1-yl diphosphate synthase [Candidatus Beckwithbacteria bacterium RBG_13_42_9]|uniref:4-hydroxy-3-methylbut-2-en-1-yl diphosphate synthase (flavodoxin) n=1 Tax=Candidatus Beckwithbacteria bacterium RBG_13_42_9 TaxID=1797457 RepID=A0A1F5E4J9_9BACT|nr:MAG: 4-hydroxy-3-methylbut-2-en-1-yl diphosphate synthase [Candidatus Beckwithbacteria bacterium RBG_13_42_9]
MITREHTKIVQIGQQKIGGGRPILVQSMVQTKTADIKATVKEIISLEKSGCEMVRVAVPDLDSAKAIKEIKKQIHIPLVADIHFQYLLALESIKNGVDKIRINPGNIGGREKTKMIVKACQEKNIPMRIGINTGSLEKDLWEKYGKLGVARVVLESATRQIQLLEKEKFYQTVVSLKGSNISQTIEAYKLFAQRYDYPLHIGITEAGPGLPGILKSAVGIGSILSLGLGDTVRVSISEKPEKQVETTWQILKALNLRQKGIEIVACPTCGRTEIDLIGLAKKVEQLLACLKAPLKVAVMGCVVNGPGEASFADIGLCGGKKQAVIFKKKKVVKVVEQESKILPVFLEEVKKVLEEKNYPEDVLQLNQILRSYHE